MSEVKRYDIFAFGGMSMDECSDGAYVNYDDYAELEAKCAALVVENARLKAMCDDRRRFIMNGVQMGYIKVPAAETDPDLETIRIAISPQKPIPATDAFLTEIERKAIRKFINSIEHILRDKLSPYDTEEMLEAMRIFLEEQEGEQKWR